jgi:hypothetical protein
MSELRLASRMALTLCVVVSKQASIESWNVDWDVHFLGVADAGDEVLGRLDDFIGDLVVGLQQHLDFGVLVFVADFALCFFGEVHGGEIVVGFEDLGQGVSN